jgi:tetratricopeptide (TPR) repeat protein
MDKKDKANQSLKNGNYEQAIELYNEILEYDKDNYNILANRSLAYIKLKKYDLALIDTVNVTKVKPESGKAWGRLGAALFGLERFSESNVAYCKANELEPQDIYKEMIEQIKNKISKVSNEPVNLFSNLFDSIMTNLKITEKITDTNFQNKVMSLQNNPMEAIKDKEIMEIMNEIFSGLKI